MDRIDGKKKKKKHESDARTGVEAKKKKNGVKSEFAKARAPKGLASNKARHSG